VRVAGSVLDPDAVWDLLLQRGVFTPGAEIACPYCQHASFLPARDLNDDVKCPRCSRTLSLGPVLVRKDPMRFRLSGLLDERVERDRRRREEGDAEASSRDDAGAPERTSFSQPAVIPVLLTLLFLSEWVSAPDATILDTSHDLSVADGVSCESDIVVISYGPRPEPHTHVLIGECKGRGHVDDEDLSNLTQLAERVERAASSVTSFSQPHAKRSLRKRCGCSLAHTRGALRMNRCDEPLSC
jgi:hypothetical protein